MELLGLIAGELHDQTPRELTTEVGLGRVAVIRDATRRETRLDRAGSGRRAMQKARSDTVGSEAEMRGWMRVQIGEAPDFRSTQPGEDAAGQSDR
jgi:hypothetical protein